MIDIKFGIIGLSIGNGHPYSWAAILNGYNVEAMAEAPFPSIPEYLSKERWPEAQLNGGSVISVYTEDERTSRQIAAASKIPIIANSIFELIEQVDAVLLARDDAENHMHFAQPILEAGLPIFIDKPIATTTANLHSLLELEQYSGQIFTCSSLAFAPELSPSRLTLRRLGKITKIESSVPKSWEKYAIHVLEPVLRLLENRGPIIEIEKSSDKVVMVTWQNDVTTIFEARGLADDLGIYIKITGENDSTTLKFTDPFRCFKLALSGFIKHINGNNHFMNTKLLEDIVLILEKGS